MASGKVRKRHKKTEAINEGMDSGIPYPGQWVVMCGAEIIAHDKDLARLRDVIKNCKKTPTIMKVPTDEIHIF
mgnify:CR=1 FL=1